MIQLIPILPTATDPVSSEAAGDIVSDVLRSYAALYARTPPTPPWIGYLAVTDADTVGTCGFKGPPAAGVVEIAYFTFPQFERRGYATAMATALIALAREAMPTARIRAHTLPESNASVRVLERTGFASVGRVVDPDDGVVWRWERAASLVAGPASGDPN